MPPNAPKINLHGLTPGRRMGVEFKITRKQRFNTAQLREKLRQHVASLIEESALHLQSAIKANLSKSGPPRSSPGGFPHKEFGDLINSIKVDVKKRPPKRHKKGPSARVFTTDPQARHIEFGATIVPKRKKMLAIPVSRAARVHARKGGDARTFPARLSPIYRKGRANILVEIFGSRGGFKRSSWIIHYVLVPSARVDPRPFMRPTLEAERGTLESIMSRPFVV